MKTISFFSLVIGTSTTVFLATPAFADWAAIAYSRTSGRHGAVAERSTSQEAAKSAINTCGKADCEVIAIDNTACIAVAADRNGTVGAASHPKWASDAAKMAVSNCNRTAKGYCQVISSICSNGGSSR
ncbi:MAG TPA: hypothetical protein DCS91_08645 [Microcoleaceae bacterium UBA11344]|nr:hypothetical protein [Microcoleaceae cyanobacterium UBA11344]